MFQAKVLGQDFVIPVGQIFPIQILQWPQLGGLRIQILEGSSGGLRNSLLAEIQIPLCDPETGLDKERPTSSHVLTAKVSWTFFPSSLFRYYVKRM